MIVFSDELKARGIIKEGCDVMTKSEWERLHGTVEGTVGGTDGGTDDKSFSSLKRDVEDLMGSGCKRSYSSLEVFVESKCKSGMVVVDKGVYRGNRISRGTWNQLQLLDKLDKAEDAVFSLCKTVNEVSVEVADGGYYLKGGTEKLFVFSRRCKTCMMYRGIHTPIGDLTIGLDDNGIDVYYFMEVLK